MVLAKIPKPGQNNYSIQHIYSPRNMRQHPYECKYVINNEQTMNLIKNGNEQIVNLIKKEVRSRRNIHKSLEM